MDGNVLFITAQGFVFKNASSACVQELMDDFAKFKVQKQKYGADYHFKVTFETREIIAQDIWIAVGAER